MHWECNSDGHIATLIKGVIYLKIIPKNIKVKLPNTDATTQINKNIHNKILHSTNLIYAESCIIIYVEQLVIPHIQQDGISIATYKKPNTSEKNWCH